MAKAAEPALMIATSNFTGGIGGRNITIREGMIFRADDQAVQTWPYAFRPIVVHESNPEPKVESATAAPGEKRGA